MLEVRGFFSFCLEMQENISNNVQIAQTLSPLKDAMGVETVDYSTYFDNMLK